MPKKLKKIKRVIYTLVSETLIVQKPKEIMQNKENNIQNLT